MSVWVAIDIGCIECGEGTEVLGVFPSKAAAVDAASARLAEHNEEWEDDWGGAYFSGGQHSIEVHSATVEDDTQ